MANWLQRLHCRLFGCKLVTLHSHRVEFEGGMYRYTVVRCERCGAVELEEG